MENGSAGVQIGKKAFISSFLILFVLMMVAGILTVAVPTGSYERTLINGSESIDWQSFEEISVDRLPVWRWFTAPVEVLWGPDSLKVIVLILLLFFIGGAFAILDRAKVLEYIVSRVINKYEKRRYFLLAFMVLFFMLFGAILGIFEEVIPLIPIVMSLAFFMGWDSLVGLGITVLAAGFGFSAAIANPFTVGLAQRLADLPAFSGTWFRIIIFITIYIMLTVFIIKYAKKIEKDPSASLVYEDDREKRKKYGKEELLASAKENHSRVKGAVNWFYTCLGGMFLSIVLGIVVPSMSDYALPLMGFMYLLAGFGCGFLAGFKPGKTLKTFIKGIGGIAPSAILILMGVSVKHIITEGNIMDSLLHGASGGLEKASPYLGIMLIYLLVLGVNFFVSSASAKAFLLIPLLVPFSEIVGLTRQATITAWAFGDGFSNVIFPTNAVLLIALGIVGISYTKWFRWTILLQLSVFAVTILFSLLAVAIGYGPF